MDYKLDIKVRLLTTAVLSCLSSSSLLCSYIGYIRGSNNLYISIYDFRCIKNLYYVLIFYNEVVKRRIVRNKTKQITNDVNFLIFVLCLQRRFTHFCHIHYIV